MSTHGDESSCLCSPRLIILMMQLCYHGPLAPHCRTIRLSLISHSSKENCIVLERFSIFRKISLGETPVSEISGSKGEFLEAGRIF